MDFRMSILGLIFIFRPGLIGKSRHGFPESRRADFKTPKHTYRLDARIKIYWYRLFTPQYMSYD